MPPSSKAQAILRFPDVCEIFWNARLLSFRQKLWCSLCKRKSHNCQIIQNWTAVSHELQQTRLDHVNDHKKWSVSATKKVWDAPMHFQVHWKLERRQSEQTKKNTIKCRVAAMSKPNAKQKFGKQLAAESATARMKSISMDMKTLLLNAIQKWKKVIQRETLVRQKSVHCSWQWISQLKTTMSALLDVWADEKLTPTALWKKSKCNWKTEEVETGETCESHAAHHHQHQIMIQSWQTSAQQCLPGRLAMSQRWPQHRNTSKQRTTQTKKATDKAKPQFESFIQSQHHNKSTRLFNTARPSSTFNGSDHLRWTTHSPITDKSSKKINLESLQLAWWFKNLDSWLTTAGSEDELTSDPCLQQQAAETPQTCLKWCSTKKDKQGAHRHCPTKLKIRMQQHFEQVWMHFKLTFALSILPPNCPIQFHLQRPNKKTWLVASFLKRNPPVQSKPVQQKTMEQCRSNWRCNHEICGACGHICRFHGHANLINCTLMRQQTSMWHCGPSSCPSSSQMSKKLDIGWQTMSKIACCNLQTFSKLWVCVQRTNCFDF